VCFQNTSDAYQCAINTGTEFTQASTWASTTDWLAEDVAISTLMLIDMSGDGRSDLCLSTDARTMFCAINEGNQFANQKQRYADLRYSDEAFKTDGDTYIQPLFAPLNWVDINADGAEDLCYRSYKGLSCALSNLNDQGTLIAVKTGFGNTSTIEYRNMNDPGIYTLDTETTDDLINLTANQYLVSSISTSNGIGGVNQMQYRYAGYKAHPIKGSRGFRYITEIDTTRNLQILTEYHQSEDLLGQAAMVTVSINGKPVRESQSTWLIRAGEKETIKKILPHTVIDQEYDQTGKLISRTITRSDRYDKYGNARRKTIESKMADDDWTKKTVITDYLNDPQSWIIGKPLKIKVIHANKQGQIKRTTRFKYHHKTGVLLSEQQNPQHKLSLTRIYKYDKNGNRVFVEQRDKAGNKRQAKTIYDNSGQFPIKNINALGHAEKITYNARCGSPKTQTGPNGLTTRWEYDALCQKVREIRPDGTETKWERQWSQGYEALYQLTDHSIYTVTAKATGTAPKTVWLDSQNREVRTRTEGFNGKAIYQDKVYDARGLLKRATLPYHEGKFPGDGAQWVESDYDAFDRLIEQRKPTAGDPIITRYTYAGNSTTVTLPNGNKKTTVNNLFDKPKTVQEGRGENTSLIQYTYDPIGNLLKTDTNGQIIRLAYDELGNKISMSDPAMGEWAYAYNAFGELIYQIDAKGQEVHIEYDLLGRITKRTEPEGESTWEYDTAKHGIGKLAREANTQTESIYTYDKFGRPAKTTKTIDGERFTTGVRYDKHGRPVEQTYPDGMKVLREYTDTGYLKTIKTPAETVEDYDYSQLEETLGLLLQQIFALQQQANDSNDKFLQYIKKAETYQITALKWQEKARKLEGKTNALVEAAEKLKAEAERLERIAQSYKEQADYYRDMADSYAKRYNNIRFNLVKNEKGYAEYSANYCASQATWKEKIYGKQVEIITYEVQVENPAYLSIQSGINAAQRELDAYYAKGWMHEDPVLESKLRGKISNLRTQLASIARYTTETRTERKVSMVLLGTETYTKCVAWQNLKIALPQIDFSTPCETDQTQEGLAWCAYGVPRELNLANFYKTRAAKYQQFINQAQQAANEKEDRAENKEQKIAKKKAKQQRYLQRSEKLMASAKQLEEQLVTEASENTELLEERIEAYHEQLTEHQAYLESISNAQDRIYTQSMIRYEAEANRYQRYSDNLHRVLAHWKATKNNGKLSRYGSKYRHYAMRWGNIAKNYKQKAEAQKKQTKAYTKESIAYYEKKVEEYQQQAQKEQERARQGIYYLKELQRKIEDYEQASNYIQTQLNDKSGNTLIWAATSYDVSGRLQGEMHGNGLITRREFDPYSGHLRRISTGIQGQQALIRDLHYSYDGMDNVTARNDAITGFNEHYRYDSFDRLIRIDRTTQSGQGDLQKRYDYDLFGNMTYKSDAGSMEYDTSNNRLLTLTSSQSGQEKNYHYDANGNRIQAGKQTIDWTSFNKAARVQSPTATSNFQYDANHQHIYQHSVTQGNGKNNGSVETTLYVGKHYEKSIIRKGLGSKTIRHKHYIYAGDNVIAIHVRTEDKQKSEQENTQFRYLHHDALGSVDTITDSNGEIVQRSQFEAFGKRTTSGGSGGAWTKRGFTGHEHLDNLGLIQMNARLYDPEIGRFLSPDIFIQAPTLSQNYNRYTYVLNNPLKYTDPSGHIIKKILGGIKKLIGHVVRFINGVLRRVINVVKHIVRGIRKYAATIVTIAVAAMVMSILPTATMAAWKVGAIAGASGGFAGGLASGGGIKAAIKGAIFGGLSGAAAGWVAHGTGIAAKGAVGAFGDGALKELVHGVTQGAIAKLRGGDFKSGFIGAIVGGYADKFARGINLPLRLIKGFTGRAVRTAIAAITGGLATKIAGGRFEDGAVSAAFRWLFNDEVAISKENKIFSLTKKCSSGKCSIYELKTLAEIMAEHSSSLSGDGIGGQKDAYRHCNASCMVSVQEGIGFAETLSVVREYLNLGTSATTGSSTADKMMDLYNDNIGRSLSSNITKDNIVYECSGRCEAAVHAGYLETIN
jgi:RHS repeat-associated protein